MTQEQPFVISISRELGSGGAYVGQQLANKLKITYVDREIVNKAAKQLDVPEKDLESRDETKTPLWRSILVSSSYMNPAMYSPPPVLEPSDKELYQTESEIIEEFAQTNSAVILGRAASYVLKDHPRHLSVFLHGAITFRTKRLMELYKIDEMKAKKLIETSDKARGVYLKAMTGKDWYDTRQYHMCLDTCSIGLDASIDIILTAVKARFGIEVK